MAKYEIVIDGDYSVLRDLLLSLNCTNLKSLDGNRFIVESNEIDQADAIETAESLLERIRASFICSRSSQPYKFKIRSIRRITPARETTTSLNYQTSLSLKIQDGYTESAEKLEHAASWMKLAEKDDNIRHVLELIAKHGLDNLVNIYRVYEVIRMDLGNEKQFREKLGVDKGKLSSFTGSMNSPKTSGHDARHAVLLNDVKIKTSMELSEAKSFILDIIEKWILIKEGE